MHHKLVRADRSSGGSRRVVSDFCVRVAVVVPANEASLRRLAGAVLFGMLARVALFSETEI